jgi:hypothetical protein
LLLYYHFKNKCKHSNRAGEEQPRKLRTARKYFWSARGKSLEGAYLQYGKGKTNYNVYKDMAQLKSGSVKLEKIRVI